MLILADVRWDALEAEPTESHMCSLKKMSLTLVLELR